MELEAEVKRLITETEATDEMEDDQYGKGRSGDELPEDLCFKQGCLSKSEEAKEALEREAREQAKHPPSQPA